MPLNFTENESTEIINSNNGVLECTQEADYSSPLPYVNMESGDVRWHHWGLASDMNLKRTAADFYLLYDLSIDEQDEGKFSQLMAWVLPQFARYTDMAVGGEIRHSLHKVKAKSAMPKPLRDALKTGELPQNRHTAWHNWKFFRQKYGTIALKWADNSFKLFSGGGYGGPRWANIAKVLYMYETGVLTPITFVDTCWGLEHNGGAYFNKAWNTHGMKKVLDANLAENFEYVRSQASPSVREHHIRVMG